MSAALCLALISLPAAADNFENSYTGETVSSIFGTAKGGAIYNASSVDSINADFINNSAVSKLGTAKGGAISNSSTINNIQGSFIGNFVFTNSSFSSGGAINNSGSIGNITGDFINNYANAAGGLLGSVNGGAISNSAYIGNITGEFIGNNVSSSYGVIRGGAIYNTGSINNIVNSSFYNNYTSTEKGNAQGGAIYTNSDLTITAKDGYTSIFSGNYTKNGNTVDNNAVYLDNSKGSLSFKLANNGSIVLNDNIRGKDGYKVFIQGDSIDNTNFYMFNDIHSADVTTGQTTINTVNDSVHTYNFNRFSLSGDTGFAVDVDLANREMDRITASSYGGLQGNLIVAGMNLLSDSQGDSTEIFFAEKGLKDNVLNGTGELPGKYQTAYTPIYKYNVNYDNRDDGGYFVFNRGGLNSGNPSESFNPSVLAPSVAAQTGAYSTQMQTFNYAFQHSDNFMNIPYLERIAIKESGRYAMSKTADAGIFSPLLTRVEKSGFWFKPYVSFENVPLKNGPKVSNINYGSLMGYDSKLTPVSHGFDRVLTGYVGYNGASQAYNGVNAYQNGGLLGGTVTLYKGNFFNATTLSAGASVGEAYNMYGHENYTMLLAGVGNKFGYNFEFKNGKYIIQPAMLMSYTFVNTFDYTNSAGVRIQSKPMHAIQLAPGVKFIMNTENGWQPYASVNMVWNIIDSSNVTANDVRLPEMSIKPYVQYGVGIQKKIKDKFLLFGQTMLSNGGRNGVALSFGLRWFFE